MNNTACAFTFTTLQSLSLSYSSLFPPHFILEIGQLEGVWNTMVFCGNFFFWSNCLSLDGGGDIQKKGEKHMFVSESLKFPYAPFVFV
jgi:hypothetical protein